jgi:hypothetical protein
VLGRFLSADTLTPGGPEGLNRYSYVNNSPVNFVDPTGHECKNFDMSGHIVEVCAPRTDIPMMPSGSKSTVSDCDMNMWACNKPDLSSLDEAVDGLIWKTIPSATGSHVSGSLQTGLLVEYGPTVEVSSVFNWRSGEYSLALSMGMHGYAGTPGMLGVELSTGPTFIYGLSKNKYLAGGLAYGGITAKVDAMMTAGLEVTAGKGLDENGGLFIDPVSNIPITVIEPGASFGGNIMTNAVDAGVFGGLQVTDPAWLVTLKMPWWPFRRGK